MKKIIFILIAVIILCGIGAFTFYNMNLKPVNADSKEEKLITIEPGTSSAAIAAKLEKEKVIKKAWAFKLYSRISGTSGFQAGTYRFSPSFDVEKIATMLSKGDVNTKVELKLAIPEGSNLRDISEVIEKNTSYKAKDVMTFLNSKEYVDSLMKKHPKVFTDEIVAKNVKYPLEGYLYPATYSYLENKPTLEEIFKPMIAKTVSIMTEYADEMIKQNVTPHQLLTMASLIEEEATQKTDREKIASVFYNRIEIGMPLQTDPTVLYALGKHKDRVLYKDLEIDDPYNTYKNKGLTPGPIANAGKSSINAALHPAKTDYLYFIATKTGEVIFNKTFADHNAAVQKHLR